MQSYEGFTVACRAVGAIPRGQERIQMSYLSKDFNTWRSEVGYGDKIKAERALDAVCDSSSKLSSEPHRRKTMKSSVIYFVVLALFATVSFAAPTPSESKVSTSTNYILHND